MKEERNNAVKAEKKTNEKGSDKGFLLFENSCKCRLPVCLAKGLRQCRDVMKSKCSKKKCKEHRAQIRLFCDRKTTSIASIGCLQFKVRVMKLIFQGQYICIYHKFVYTFM